LNHIFFIALNTLGPFLTMHGQTEMLIILSTVSQPCKLDNYSGIRFLEFNFVDTLVQSTYENPRKKELNNIL